MFLSYEYFIPSLASLGLQNYTILLKLLYPIPREPYGFFLSSQACHGPNLRLSHSSSIWCHVAAVSQAAIQHVDSSPDPSHPRWYIHLSHVLPKKVLECLNILCVIQNLLRGVWILPSLNFALFNCRFSFFLCGAEKCLETQPAYLCWSLCLFTFCFLLNLYRFKSVTVFSCSFLKLWRNNFSCGNYCWWCVLFADTPCPSPFRNTALAVNFFLHQIILLCFVICAPLHFLVNTSGAVFLCVSGTLFQACSVNQLCLPLDEFWIVSAHLQLLGGKWCFFEHFWALPWLFGVDSAACQGQARSSLL